MNRHENVVCKGCGEVDFAGRCYRCLSCDDFNMCADCYDNDFTSPQHPFDHPVKCILTPADVEVYFGGEYLNDPPQSYRCPYCKEWGYNESTFLEHVSAVHVGASTLLVSTMVTLFERQQAARLFLEDEQLTVFTEAAASRNTMMNRSEGSLDLFLEPLNPDGSYQAERPVVPLTFRLVKPGAVEVAPWMVEGNAISDPNNNTQGFGSNFLIPETVRRRSLLERARNRFNFDRPPLPLPQQQQPQQEQQQQPEQPEQPGQPQQQQEQPQQQQESNNPQPEQQQQSPPSMFAVSDIIRFNEPLPTSRSSRPPAFRGFNQFNNPATASARMLPFGSDNMRRAFFPPSELIRNRAQRHRTPRVRMDAFPSPTGVRQVHLQRFRTDTSQMPAVPTSPNNSGGSMQRIVEFNELATGVNDLITHNMLRTIEEEGTQQQQQSAEELKLLEQQERERYLCFPFLTASSPSCEEPEEQILFLAKRAEFVAQLLASVLCEEQLELNVPSPAPPAPNAVGPTERTVCPMPPISKLRNRSTSEYAGAGDSQLDLKHTTLHNTANI